MSELATTEQTNVNKIYEMLLFIRRMELEIADVYPSDKIKSPVHLSIGQEFISVAVCLALNAGDYVSATYRGHAAYLAKGGCPKKLIAEMYGKRTGCSKGRGGSMHLIEPEVNFLGSSAIVGTGVPNATGVALAQKMRSSSAVVVCFLGDGATEEGCFYESLNFAGLHKLPILYVVENNHLAIHEPTIKRWAEPDLAPRVMGFGVETSKFTTSDVLGLYSTAKQLISGIRNGEGPKLIEVDCCRWYQHVGPNQDTHLKYRSEEYTSIWFESDPLVNLAKKLSDEALLEVENKVMDKVRDAFEFAENSEFPNADEIFEYVYRT